MSNILDNPKAVPVGWKRCEQCGVLIREDSHTQAQCVSYVAALAAIDSVMARAPKGK
jgi:hypothetical protein